MQQKNLWIFTEKNKDDVTFLKAIQNSENAVIFLTQTGEGRIVQKIELIPLVKSSIVFFESNKMESVEQITPDFVMKVFVSNKKVDNLLHRRSFLFEL